MRRTMNFWVYLFILLMFQSCNKEKAELKISGVNHFKIIISDTSLTQKPIDESNSLSDDKRETEFEIIKIIKSFQTKDSKTLNSYINKEIRFYLIPGPGTLLNLKQLDKIDFSDDEIAYHQFGKTDLKNQIFTYTKDFPQYNCETYDWDRYGIFVSLKDNNIMTNIITNPQRAIQGWDSETEIEIEKAQKIDKMTIYVKATQKDGDVIFGFAKYKGKYILTFLDFQQSYCDI